MFTYIGYAFDRYFINKTIVSLISMNYVFFCIKKAPSFKDTKEIFSNIIKMSDTCYNWFSINNWNSKPSTAAWSKDKRTWMDNWGILKSFKNNLYDLHVVMLVFPINIPSAFFYKFVSQQNRLYTFWNAKILEMQNILFDLVFELSSSTMNNECMTRKKEFLQSRATTKSWTMHF